MKHITKFLLLASIIFLNSCISSNGIAVKKVDKSTYEKEGKNKLDHSAWDALLKKHVEENGLVNYEGFKADGEKLNTYVTYLSQQKPEKSWSTKQHLAYFINVYNANTIKLIVDNYPIESIKDVDATISPFLKNFIFIKDKKFSLADIEKGILQKMNEPRIHFAINCASYSCPKLLRDAFTAENVDDLMERAAKEFVNSDKNKISKTSAELSEIFKWYKKDFLKSASSIMEYVNRYSKVKINENVELRYIDYDWKLNDTK